MGGGGGKNIVGDNGGDNGSENIVGTLFGGDNGGEKRQI